MNEYLISRKDQSSFKGISLKTLSFLYNLVNAKPYLGIPELKRRFSEISFLFEDNLLFLKAVRLLKITAKGVFIPKGFSDSSIDRLLTQRLKHLKGSYRTEIRLFLSKAVVHSSGLEIRIDDQLVSFFAPLRNFLIELRLLAYGKEKRLFLNPIHKEVFYGIQRPNTSSSPLKILEASKKNLLFGLKVEQEVIKDEIKRLGAGLKNQIIHVSLNDSEAGYDIKSLKRVSNEEYANTYLEVKAVSANNWAFFWTKNEKQCSKLLGECYCMVLVPCEKGLINIKAKKEIWNPFIYLRDSKEWLSEVTEERYYLR